MMEFTIEFGGDPQDVTVTFSGVADLAGFRRYGEAISSDPRFRAGLIFLVDASALDTSQMSSEHVQAASEPVSERDWNHPPRAVAIVAPDPRTFKDFGYARAHQGGSRSRRRVFRSQEAALGWLNEQRRSE
jgi:hypothetical protein